MDSGAGVRLVRAAALMYHLVDERAMRLMAVAAVYRL